jgi:hypothetical protein
MSIIRLQFIDEKGKRIELDEMTELGLGEARYQCKRWIEDIDEALYQISKSDPEEWDREDDE